MYETAVHSVSARGDVLLRGHRHPQTGQPANQRRRRGPYPAPLQERGLPTAVLNLQIARTYLSASDAAIAKRTWQVPMTEGSVQGQAGHHGSPGRNIRPS